MPSKRAPKRPRAIRSPPGQRPDGQGVPETVRYEITKPRVTPEGWVELDGSLFARAALEYRNGRNLT